MKYLVVLALSVACASAIPRLPRSVESEAPVLRSSYESDPEGNFRYGYETANGIVSDVDGVVKNSNSDFPALEIKGVVKYTAPGGIPIELGWVANENGFVPYGSHLPVSPPIPDAILRSLQYIHDHLPPVERVVVKQQ